MRRHIEMVREFHEHCKVGRVQRLDEIAPSVRDLNDRMFNTTAHELQLLSAKHEALIRPNDERHVRAHLLLEELAEFVQAIAEGDEESASNALADIAFVTFGASLVFDLPLAEEFEETWRSNMTKEKQPTDPSADRLRAKGPNYVPPDTAGVLRRHRAKQGR